MNYHAWTVIKCAHIPRRRGFQGERNLPLFAFLSASLTTTLRFERVKFIIYWKTPKFWGQNCHSSKTKHCRAVLCLHYLQKVGLFPRKTRRSYGFFYYDSQGIEERHRTSGKLFYCRYPTYRVTPQAAQAPTVRWSSCEHTKGFSLVRNKPRNG